MQVTFEFLAQLRTLAGTANEARDVDASTTVQQAVLDLARERGGDFAKLVLDATGERLHPSMLLFGPPKPEPGPGE